MPRALNREVTTSRPSTASKVRMLAQLPRRAVTRTRRVRDWMAGGLAVSRRSRSSYVIVSVYSSRIQEFQRTFM